MDALAEAASTHGIELSHPPPSSKRQRTQLACAQCSKNKTKCETEGGAFCRRCARLGIVCDFPSGRFITAYSFLAELYLTPLPIWFFPRLNRVRTAGGAPEVSPESVSGMSAPNRPENSEIVAILRALTEHCPASNKLVTTVPLELLSEWAFTALEQRDCALLGYTLTIAAACGHSLSAL